MASPRNARIDLSIDFLRYKIVKHRPGQKIHNFNKIGSRNQYRSIEHKKISILTVSASKSIRTTKKCPKNLPKNPSTSTDLNRPHPDPFINHQNLGFGPSNPYSEKERFAAILMV